MRPTESVSWQEERFCVQSSGSRRYRSEEWLAVVHLRATRYGGQPSYIRERRLVDQMCASWNPLRSWPCQLDGLSRTDFVSQESTSLLTLEQDKIAERLLSAENE